MAPDRDLGWFFQNVKPTRSDQTHSLTWFLVRPKKTWVRAGWYVSMAGGAVTACRVDGEKTTPSPSGDAAGRTLRDPHAGVAWCDDACYASMARVNSGENEDPPNAGMAPYDISGGFGMLFGSRMAILGLAPRELGTAGVLVKDVKVEFWAERIRDWKLQDQSSVCFPRSY